MNKNFYSYFLLVASNLLPNDSQLKVILGLRKQMSKANKEGVFNMNYKVIEKYPRHSRVHIYE